MVTPARGKWHAVVVLLTEVQRLIDGEEFGGYVDVGSAGEAITELIDDAKWKTFESAGPVVTPGLGSFRIIDGEQTTFTDFWGE